MASLKAKGVRLKSAGSRFLYNASNLPNPSPVVPEVLLLIHPSFGLCTIVATSITHDDNSFGERTRAEYEKVKRLLVGRYSVPTKSYDFVRSGSIWDEEKYFMIGLDKGERTLTSFWMKSDGARLPKGIQNLQVKAQALSSVRGYVSVKYESDKHGQCVDSTQQLEAGGI